MANVLIFNVFLVLILSGVESCFMPSSQYVNVPQTIPSGKYITTVEVGDCDTKTIHFTVYDPSFVIYRNGTVVAVNTMSVTTEKTLAVYVGDNMGQERIIVVHLSSSEIQRQKRTNTGFLRRSKRRWSPPPFNIIEEESGPYPQEIEKIVSDSASDQEVYYTISGPGVELPPVGLFTLDKYSGMLSVNRAVDREQFSKFVITTRVFNRISNKETDLPLDIAVVVDDINDNAPTFKDSMQFTVPEKSAVDTFVGLVNATDRDEVGSLHVKIKYSLLTGLDLFKIHPVTGVITTKTNTLDREAKEKHMVTVQIKDMDGAVTGLFNTATATITLSDVNDNPPTFLKPTYEANVNENEKEKCILRIPVEDKDLQNTANWNSKFVITKGNENGHFRIDRDPKTNEGLLCVSKPLDFEKTPKVNLEVMAKNEAELKGTSAQWKSIPVSVAVNNVDEGPEFTAPTVRFNVKENSANGTKIGIYEAVDPETKSSDGIKYYRSIDPGSWIDINRDNGELRVANTIDRESPFVKNGEYPVIVKAVDAGSKTGTGTIIIDIEDENDNKPTIPGSELVLCEKQGEMGSVLVVAEDKDESPFSSPFSFSLPSNDGTWSLTKVNDTTATLKQLKELPTGIYKVPIDVKDLQGYGEEQIANVRICQCRNGVCLAKERNVSLGPMGILALLLPLALLLLLCLLLAFFCATKGEKMQIDDGGDSGGILLKSNTEAPGEEVDANLINVPITTDTIGKGSVKGVNTAWPGGKSTSTIGGMGTHENGMYMENNIITNTYDQFDGTYGSQFNGGHMVGSGMGIDSRYMTQDFSFLQTWATNGRYLQTKLPYLGTEDDGRFANDIIHSYGYEGAGSLAGSVGCCSDFGDNENLDFLNTLGPKFKGLAETAKKT
ncbi:desmocollin 2 like [Xyrichtys novacula]|uniref:Desmocollin 2 like n=1 Tax=Xyrichtys novacula TaxID=13765 RepID=A0AAV1GGS4_XYRNO|nr:desmocollin 2 like [Xyrichtys novacula]